MGKKGKGTKKEDKPKKEVPQTTASKNKAMQEALEGTNVTVNKATPTPPRTAASKKSERGGSTLTKIGCTESFRWDNSEKAPVLLPMEEFRRKRTPATTVARSFFLRPEPFPTQFLQALCNWPLYLHWRTNGNPALLEAVHSSKTLKDGLSAPLTIAYMIMKWAILDVGSVVSLESGEPLHIVLVGATAVHEEKILRESDYWDELLVILSKRKVRLYLTGPEMSGKDGEFKRKRHGADEGQGQEEDGPRVECWKASAIDFFLKRGRLELFQKEDTVVVGLNCGFGVAARRMMNTAVPKQDQASNEVLWNWIPTLRFIAALELPLMVTSCDEQSALFARVILEQVVGMYNVAEMVQSPAPFESTIPGQEHEVRANARFLIAQGQQSGYHFATDGPQPGDKDSRLEELRKIVGLSSKHALKSRKWEGPSSIPKRLLYTRDRDAPLAPLKRYGNYPPENLEKCKPDDDGESETDVPVRGGRRNEKENEEEGGGLRPPAVVKLKHSVVDEGPGSLKVIVEDVFMTDPATARVGMRRHSFALHYFDCQTLRDVVFEAALPKEVDHTTTQTTFKRSAASITIVVRLLETKT